MEGGGGGNAPEKSMNELGKTNKTAETFILVSPTARNKTIMR